MRGLLTELIPFAKRIQSEAASPIDPDRGGQPEPGVIQRGKNPVAYAP